MPARALVGAPMHRHSREDEYTYVLEGSIGALLGDSVVIGNPGDLIFKPRNQWHTFWNCSRDSPVLSRLARQLTSAHRRVTFRLTARPMRR